MLMEVEGINEMHKMKDVINFNAGLILEKNIIFTNFCS